MTPSDLFHAGRLRDAIDAQTQKVRSSPADNAARFFLFELLLFVGDLDRARKQLDVLRYDDPQHSAAVQQYRNALDAEAKRRAVFAGREPPTGLAGAPDHVRLRFEAVAALARGDHAAARAHADEANAAAPAVPAAVNGLPAAGLADADERLGPVLEVFGTGGVYSWVPLERVTDVTMNPPRSPRDVVWRPARLALVDGLEGDVLLPGLYPLTHEHPEEPVRLGRETDWLGADDELARGAGGRVFRSGESFTPFVTVTHIAPASA